MTKISKLIVSFVLGFFLCASSQIAFASTVIINEIAWAGTTEDWRQEWIELFNNSGRIVDVAGWQIDNGASGNKTLVLSSGTTPADGYFLICRTEMAGCDLVETKLSLHNEYDKNGKLALRDSSGALVDAAPEPEGAAWPGGDNTTKQTMERANTGWQTSAEPNGTPDAQNSQAPVLSETAPPPPTILPEPAPLPEPAISTEQEQPAGRSPTPSGFAATSTMPVSEPIQSPGEPETAEPFNPEPIIYPSAVYINEVLPSPEGADAENEWIELFNNNDFEVDLSGWQIRDKIGAVRTYTFPTDTKIVGLGFLVLGRTKSNITLQNSGDTLELLNPNQEIINSIGYPKAPQGQSYNRGNNGWDWSQTLTPGTKNIISQPKIAANSKEKQNVNTNTDDAQNAAAKEAAGLPQNLLASAAQNLPKSSSRLFVFLIAAAIAVFSAIIVLFLNKKITAK